MIRSIAAALLAGVAAFGLARTAHADAIDGAWCNGPQRLSIAGPSVMTPDGSAISGDYSRHFFSYVVPPNEPRAGAQIQMRLLNEETMQMRAGENAQAETWNRCTPPVS